MLEQSLKKAVSVELTSFEKLTEGHDPYYFSMWDEEDGTSILRYWFWNKAKTEKRRKRVFVSEIESLLRYAHKSQFITRDDFRTHCPRTNSDGGCGFAVIIRILEHFQVVEIALGSIGSQAPTTYDAF